MAYCEECGTKLAEGAKFCPKCGHKSAVAETKPIGTHPESEQPKPTAEPVIQAVQELVGAVVREVDAPPVVGESVLCTWKNAGVGSLPSAAQAQQMVGSAVAQAQQATQGMGQFQAHQPTVRTSSQSRGGAAPAAKKSKLPVILIGVGAVILVAAFALYVVPRFIFHPVDPNEHTALTSDSSQSSSTSASASSEGASSASSSDAVSTESSASASASSSASSASSEATPPSSSAASPTNYSTYERPVIGDFKWLDGEAMKGNVPAGAQRIVDLGALTGSWKGYVVGSNMEWLANPYIDIGQSGVIFAIDWYYLRNASGDVIEDTTPSSMFEGTFDGGMLDATGSGRVTIAAFWEKDGHQYGVGSYILPSGETTTIALVRP